MNIRPLALLLAAPLALAAVTTACGSGKSATVQRLPETEPNDTLGQANAITRNWASIHVEGSCSSATDVDWFKISFTNYVSPAPMAATLNWTGAGALSFTLYDSLGTSVLSSDTSPSPEVVTMTLTTSGVFYLEIQCGGTIAPTDGWTFDIPAPGADPGSV